MKKYFITSSGTNIGKTFLVSSLCHLLKSQGKSVFAIKPIITGFSEEDSDSNIILKARDMPVTSDNINKISPWRFSLPLAPNIAAGLENKEIDFSKVVEFCNKNTNSDYNFIEGVGGIMVPINSVKTIADLIEELRIPALLVVGTYLGAISHALTAYEVLKKRGIKIHAVIVNESLESTGSSEILRTLNNFISEPLFFLPLTNSNAALEKIADFL